MAGKRSKSKPKLTLDLNGRFSDGTSLSLDARGKRGPELYTQGALSSLDEAHGAAVLELPEWAGRGILLLLGHYSALPAAHVPLPAPVTAKQLTDAILGHYRSRITAVDRATLDTLTPLTGDDGKVVARTYGDLLGDHQFLEGLYPGDGMWAPAFNIHWGS